MSSKNKLALLNQVIDANNRHSMIGPGESVLVCVSGGSDSVALLAVLIELKEKLGIHKIFALHVNHNLRTGARDDEIFVQNLCGRMSILLEVQDIDVRDFAAQNNKGLEEAGRIIRHRYAKLASASFGAEKIAMGHNMGDNAETIVLNLCRGTGLRGMTGIPPINGKVVRPLISSSRADILKYLGARNQPYVTDSSNFTNEFTRNRIRNIIIPSLEGNVNSNAGALIARSAELFWADEEYLNKQAADCFTEIVTQTEGETVLDTTKLNELHFSISSRVIKMVLEKLELTDISQAQVKAVLELSAGNTGRKFNISNIQAVKEYYRIVFSKSKRGSKGFNYFLELEKPLFIPEISKTIIISWLEFRPQPYVNPGGQGLLRSSPMSAANQRAEQYPCSPGPRGWGANCNISSQNFSNYPAPYCTKLLKYDNMPKSVVIRTRQAGDRICLSSKDGLRFTKKLQDFFINAKIPASQRSEIPILTIDEKIAWLVYDAGKKDVGVTGSDFRADNSTGGIYVTIWEGNYAGNNWRRNY